MYVLKSCENSLVEACTVEACTLVALAKDGGGVLSMVAELGLTTKWEGEPARSCKGRAGNIVMVAVGVTGLGAPTTSDGGYLPTVAIALRVEWGPQIFGGEKTGWSMATS